jgi:hypothetical protein
VARLLASCSRHGVAAVRLTSERPESVTLISKTSALLVVHSQLHGGRFLNVQRTFGGDSAVPVCLFTPDQITSKYWQVYCVQHNTSIYYHKHTIWATCFDYINQPSSGLTQKRSRGHVLSLNTTCVPTPKKKKPQTQCSKCFVRTFLCAA